VIETSGNPIPSASVEIIGTPQGTAANENGAYGLLISKKPNIKLRISALGFTTKEIALVSASDSTSLNISLVPEQKLLDEVVVVSFPKISSYRLGGAVSIVRMEEMRTVIADTITNLIKPSEIKLYPNPVSKNSFVNVKLVQKGSYQLTVIDNSGNVIQQNRFIISAKHMAYQLELPESIAAGMYYIKVVEESTNKQYTQKLIVQ